MLLRHNFNDMIKSLQMQWRLADLSFSPVIFDGEDYDQFKKSSIAENKTIVDKFQREIQLII